MQEPAGCFYTTVIFWHATVLWICVTLYSMIAKVQARNMWQSRRTASHA